MKLSNLKIGHRLGAGFGMIIILMIAITGIGVFRLFMSNSSFETMVTESYPRTILANTVKADSNDVMGNIRNILIDPASAQQELSLAEESTQFATENVGKLQKAMNGSDEEKSKIQALIDARAPLISEQAAFVKSAKEGHMEQAATMFPQIKMLSDTYMQTIDTLISYQENVAGIAGKEVTAMTRKALILMIVLASIASVLGMSIGILTTRGITRPLNEAVQIAERVAKGDLTLDIHVQSGDETGKLMQALKHMNESLVEIVKEVRSGTEAIATESCQIAGGATDLSSRTEQQASSLEETASSMLELTATVKQNADNAALANQQGISATETALRGGAVVSQVIETMGKIKESSRQIVSIIGVIDSIAFQTNILALNAAVEAARAGNQGRGFAVVAAEVRNLAQRSAEAAKEIKALIRDSVDKVDAGNALVGEAGQTMNEILSAIKHVADIMSQITAASQEQSMEIASVTQAVHLMDSMTRENAAALEQASAASESMQAQTAHLAQAVRIFKLLDTEFDNGGRETWKNRTFKPKIVTFGKAPVFPATVIALGDSTDG